MLTNKKCHKTTGTSKSAVPKRPFPFLMLGVPACETESGLLHPHQQLCFGNQVDNSSCYDLFPTTQCRRLTQTPGLSGLSRGWIRGSMVGTARNFSSYYRRYAACATWCSGTAFVGKRIRFFLLGRLFHWCGAAAKSRSRLLTLHWNDSFPNIVAHSWTQRLPLIGRGSSQRCLVLSLFWERTQAEPAL